MTQNTDWFNGTHVMNGTYTEDERFSGPDTEIMEWADDRQLKLFLGAALLNEYDGPTGKNLLASLNSRYGENFNVCELKKVARYLFFKFEVSIILHNIKLQMFIF